MTEIIRTIRGDMPKSKLGWCQCHEHLFLQKGASYKVNKALCADDYKKSLAELVLYKNAGGSAYVDAQPLGCGRMVKSMEAACDESDVHIIAVSGFHKLCFFDEVALLDLSQDELARIYIKEINSGMYENYSKGEETNAKAGLIKVAMEAGGIYGNKTYTKLFYAAIDGAKKTNAPIIAHFEENTDVFELLKLMQSQGIEANKLIACHLDRAKYDFGYHREVAKEGVYLEYDTINRLNYHSNEKEIDIILELLDSGFEKNLLFSLDTTANRLKSYDGDMGLDYILKDFSQQLEKNNVSKVVINNIMKENSANAISFCGN